MNSYALLVSSLIIAISAITVAWLIGRAKSSSGSAVSAEINPEQLLGPIREQISVIVGRLDKTSEALAITRTSISEELGNVLTVSKEVRGGNQELAMTTERISTALSGTGVRGNWGQVSLRRVVELAGLTKHVTFSEQEKYIDKDGEIIPDMVVSLPGDRKVVVDAKAPKIDLTGKEDFSTADLLRVHIKDLAGRDYSARVGGAVDFTVLFVPSEGVMATALTEDNNLTEFALQKKILLATPMTLLALLRAIEFGWKQTEQMENVSLILKESKDLCDKFGIMGEHFASVGKYLKDSVDAYNDAVASINRTLKPQVRKIGALGIDVKRSESDFSEVDFKPKSLNQD